MNNPDCKKNLSRQRITVAGRTLHIAARNLETDLRVLKAGDRAVIELRIPSTDTENGWATSINVSFN